MRLDPIPRWNALAAHCQVGFVIEAIGYFYFFELDDMKLAKRVHLSIVEHTYLTLLFCLRDRYQCAPKRFQVLRPSDRVQTGLASESGIVAVRWSSGNVKLAVLGPTPDAYIRFR